MIQRIQSVFLLLLALCMLSMLALPLWHKADPQSSQEITLTAYSLDLTKGPDSHPAGSPWPIAALAVTAAAIAAYEIFQFRDRKKQLLLGSLNLLLIAATIGAAFFYSSRGEQLLNIKLEGQFLPGFYLPTLALLLNLLANRFIRSDERLVRSQDRLR
jgi:hypothetical protein